MPYRSYRKPKTPKTIGSNPRSSNDSGKLSPHRGRLSNAEKDTINAIVKLTPGGISKQQSDAIAIVLKRDRATIARAVDAAQNTLQQNARRYVDIHLLATEAALEAGEHDTARKAAEFAMKSITAKREDGSTARIIDPETTEPRSGPQVKIGIALGGMSRTLPQTTERSIDAEAIDTHED